MPNLNDVTRDRHCVIPGVTEQELAVLPGPTPDSALRVRVESSAEGFVRLEQMAFNADLGWYTQKSFCIPAEMLTALATQLRKADCLMPRGRTTATAGPSLRLVPAPEHDAIVSQKIEA